MKKVLLVCFITGLFTNLHAQEMWGISNSNYSGNMGIALNPSTIVAAPYKYDLNLFAMDVFIQNNYAWFPASDKLLYSSIHGSKESPTLVVDDFSGSKKSLF